MTQLSVVAGRVVANGYLSDRWAKSIPGARLRQGVWSWPLTWQTITAIKHDPWFELSFSDELIDFAHSAKCRFDELMSLKTAATAVGDSALWPHQRAGAKFLRTAGSGLLLDPMGAGKTWTAIEWLLSYPKPRLVICPTSVLSVWANALSARASFARVALIQGTPKQRLKALSDTDADVHLISWTNLPTHSGQATWGGMTVTDAERKPKELQELRPRTIVADEAHRAKRPEAKQTRALWRIGDDAEYRVGLTGTPIENSPRELWSLLRFIDPAGFSSRTSYVDRYLEVSWNGWGLDVTDVLPERKAEWDDATTHLWRRFDPPPIGTVSQVRTIPMSTAQRRQYNQMSKQLIAEMPEGKLIAWDPLQRGLRLWQISQSAVMVDGAPRLPSCKLDALMDLLSECEGVPVVTFATHARLLRLFEQELNKSKVRVGVLDGTCSLPERTSLVDRHMNGELDCLMVTYGAGGEGITLTSGNVVCLIEGATKASTLDQAVARVARPGQTKTVQVVVVESADSYDTHMRNLCEGKAEYMNKLVDREVAMTWLS